MSEPWWKLAPNPDAPNPVATEKPAPPVAAARGLRLRCSAEGCQFESDLFHSPAAGPELRPYCERHLKGRDVEGTELFWALPCACGRVAAGYEREAGASTATHSERRCIVRTISLLPAEITEPSGFALRDPVEPTWVGRRARCACGRKADGVQSSTAELTESHSFRQCIEMTVKVVPGDVTLPDQ
jgi:hypothetical protein